LHFAVEVHGDDNVDRLHLPIEAARYYWRSRGANNEVLGTLGTRRYGETKRKDREEIKTSVESGESHT
jgi:hypothetical protein